MLLQREDFDWVLAFLRNTPDVWNFEPTSEQFYWIQARHSEGYDPDEAASELAEGRNGAPTI